MQAGYDSGKDLFRPKSDQIIMLIDEPHFRAKYDRAWERYWQARKRKANSLEEYPLPANGTKCPISNEPVSNPNPEDTKAPTALRSSSTEQSEQPKKADKTLFDKKEAI